MNNNCHIPDFVQAFSNVKNGGLNLVPTTLRKRG